VKQNHNKVQKKILKDANMNRQAKIQKMYDKRLKRARAKLKTSSKAPYISKADRAKTELENSTEDKKWARKAIAYQCAYG